MQNQPSEEEKFYKAANEKMQREKEGQEAAGKFIFCGLPLLFAAIFFGLLLLTWLFGR